jgi:hypothetical protein
MFPSPVVLTIRDFLPCLRCTAASLLISSHSAAYCWSAERQSVRLTGVEYHHHHHYRRSQLRPTHKTPLCSSLSFV